MALILLSMAREPSLPPYQVEGVKAGGVGASPRVTSLTSSKRQILRAIAPAVLRATLD